MQGKTLHLVSSNMKKVVIILKDGTEGRSVTSLTSPALDHLPRHKVEKGGEDVDNGD